MYTKLSQTISSLPFERLSAERMEILQPFIDYLQHHIQNHRPINLNFICTHNSRRSILAQIWAQTLAYYFKIDQVYCYSGGTEATAVFPKVVQTLHSHGFEVYTFSNEDNPVYAIKCDKNLPAMICFSKEYSHFFNPTSDFTAIMTCNHADEVCPVVNGADARFSINYDDPKVYDDTTWMDLKYQERSLEIANEMYYVFSHLQIHKN